MKSLRDFFLLSLVVLLLASCVGLPPVLPQEAPSTQGFEEPVTRPTTEPPGSATESTPAVEAPAAEATPAITEGAVVTATEAVASPAAPEAASTPTEEQVMGANPLVAVVWEWAALLKTKPAAQSVVPDPTSYTLVFADDGTLAVKADCNNAIGSYTLENDRLTLQIGGVTRAACPPGSLGDAMLASLARVGSYMIDEGDLILRLSDGNESMLFRNGGPPAEAATPPSATEAPAAVTPLPTPAPAEIPAKPLALVGPVWQWESYVDTATGKNSMNVKDPESYTVTFMDDGTAAMRADCNRAAGTYTVDGKKLTVEVGPVTLAACGPDSLGQTYLIHLTNAATYAIDAGKLTIDLAADDGRMVFAPEK